MNNNDKYGVRTMRDYDYTSDQAYNNLKLDITGHVDNCIMIISPCRSGSTALLNAITMGSWNGYYQPMKTALRRYIMQDEEQLHINTSSSNIVIKETLGPYFPSEVYYNPLKILEKQRLQIKNLKLIFLIRQPEECLISWVRLFGKNNNVKFSPNLFGKSYAATLTLYEDAIKKQIPSAILPCSYLSNSNVLPELMHELGLEFEEEMRDWTRSTKYQEGKLTFQKPRCPELLVTAEHDGVRYGKTLSKTGNTSTEADMQLPLSTNKTAELSDATRIYNYFIDIRHRDKERNIRPTNCNKFGGHSTSLHC